jgi:hypothetical protein
LTYYLQHPLDIVNFWSGGFRGLGIYGGVAGGLLALWLYAWHYKLNVAKYIDFIAINVLDDSAFDAADHRLVRRQWVSPYLLLRSDLELGGIPGVDLVCAPLWRQAAPG